MKKHYPFSAIVEQEEFKLALILNVIDPSIGGVLAVGDKGTGKTTLCRSLAGLLNRKQSVPFVNLPIGATEDRVLGHIDLGQLINEKKEHVTPGLLAQSHKGFLYVDEINLLNDYLMDSLLDASSSGSYFLEREGISKKLESQFCLVGSMNPEEGDLRPQLKDRFGLSVNIETPKEIKTRQLIIKNRLAFDDDSASFVDSFEKEEQLIFNKLKKAKTEFSKVAFSDEIITFCAQVAAENEVEGLRADVLLLKTARAYSAYLGLKEVDKEHVELIAPLVLNHRSNKKQSQEQNRPENEDQNQSNNQNEEPGSSSQNQEILIPKSELNLNATTGKSAKNGVSNDSTQTIATKGDLSQVDLKQTVGQYLATNQFELKHKQTSSKTSRHLIFALDASGSMQKNQLTAYAKGFIEKALEKYKQASFSYSLLALTGGGAEVVLSEVKNQEELIQALSQVKAGGITDSTTVFKKIKMLTQSNTKTTNELILITDGRFNSEGTESLDNAVMAFKMYCKAIHQLTVVDAEQDTVKLGLAKQFATRTKGTLQTLEIG